MNILTKNSLMITGGIFLLWQFSFAQSIVCSFCNKKVTQQYVLFENLKYHAHCYRDHIQPKCDFCHKQITKKYSIVENKKYHITCYREHVLFPSLPICAICEQRIEGTYISDYWSNVYHKYHLNKHPKCQSCHRLISDRLTKGGRQVAPHRNVCHLCFPFVVQSKKEVAICLKEVKTILNAVGIKNLPNSIPVTLVQKQKQLAKMSNLRSSHLSGYTQYKYQMSNQQIIGEDYHVYVLSHLHVVEFKAVLAHELLHVFLFQNQYQMSKQRMEGFCNLGAQLIYQKDNSKFAQYKLSLMYENDDPIYGIGFKKMNRILEKIGWQRLLKKISSW